VSDVKNDIAAAAILPAFWRRIGAFIADLFVLGLVGVALGTALSSQFVALGPWGRVVGFAIALAYFGVLNSRVTGGQTPGKKLLGIRVVDSSGKPLGLGRSLLRFLPLGIPYFLNNAQFSVAVLLSPLIYVLSLAIFGLALSLLYLYVFNRRTRQSLDDLLVGSFVVRATATETPRAAVWRGHYVVCGVLLLATAIVPYFTKQLTANLPWNQMLAVVEAVAEEPWVAHNLVEQGFASASGGDGTTKTTYFQVNAILRSDEVSNEARAIVLASKVLDRHAGAESFDTISITLSYGYDIGIASRWNTYNHVYSPKEWREKIATSAS